MENKKIKIKLNSTKKMILTAILFAVSLILSLIESTLPAVPIPVPGVKFGLANIVVMYTLFFINGKTALFIVVLKAMFVGMTRGVTSGILSMSGGLLSLTIMILLLLIFRDKISYLILSIAGAIFHNVGQFIAISILYVGMNFWFYVPILLISGVVAGVVTSTLLRFLLPSLKRLEYK